MRKLLVPLAVVAALGMSSFALAAATTTQGTVKAIDSKAMTLTLSDGGVYHLASTIKVADIKAGAKVKITWDKVGTTNEASAVVLEK